jgi:hypothetical protein
VTNGYCRHLIGASLDRQHCVLAGPIRAARCPTETATAELGSPRALRSTGNFGRVVDRPGVQLREVTLSGRTIGNLILMTLICIFVFIVFMAVRPTKASAQNFQRGAELSDLARPYHPATVLDLISPEAVTCS